MRHPNPIHRALWRPVLWMGTERIPGALWLLLIILLVLMGVMLAGVWIVTTLIVAGGVAGFVSLQKLAEKDPQMTRVFLRKTLRYRGIYPACRTRIASHGRQTPRTERGTATRVGAGPGNAPRDIWQAGQRLAALKAKLRGLGRVTQDRLSTVTRGTGRVGLKPPAAGGVAHLETAAGKNRGALPGSEETPSAASQQAANAVGVARCITGSRKDCGALPGSEETPSAASQQAANADGVARCITGSRKD